MGQTFYTILGVEQDAGSGAIRQAYRSQVKECHPDVTDDPNASERFKRLTTARDVLLDTDERSAYDRLGHDAYIRKHVESSVWSSADGDTAGSTATGSRSQKQASWGHSATRSSSTGATANSGSSGGSANRTWSGTGSETDSRETVGGTHSTEHTQWRDRRRTQRDNRPRWSQGGGRAEKDWQRAPNAYMSADTSTGARSSAFKTVFSAIRRIGPWLFIHLTLVVSALATTWFMFNRPGTDPVLAVATATFSLLLVGVVLLLSLVHLLTELA